MQLKDIFGIHGDYLEREGYTSIDIVCEDRAQTKRKYDNLFLLTQEQCKTFEDRLRQIQLIKNEYESLLLSCPCISPEEISFLQKNNQENAELLDKTIKKTKKSIAECEY